MGFNPFKGSSWKKLGKSIDKGIKDLGNHTASAFTAGQCDTNGCGSKNKTGNVYYKIGDAAVNIATLGQCDGGGCAGDMAHSDNIFGKTLGAVLDVPIVGDITSIGLSMAFSVPIIGPIAGNLLGTIINPNFADQEFPEQETIENKLLWYYLNLDPMSRDVVDLSFLVLGLLLSWYVLKFLAKIVLLPFKLF